MKEVGRLRVPVCCSRVFTVASLVLWCVGGIEARLTFFPVSDSCPEHGTVCKQDLGELQKTHEDAHWKQSVPAEGGDYSHAFRSRRLRSFYMHMNMHRPPSRHEWVFH